MAKTKAVAKYKTIIPREIRQLFGPPPLLSTEDPDLYERTFAGFAQSLRPRDALEWMIVRDLTDEYWELQRHKNFKPLLIEQAYERQVKRATEQVESDFCAKAHALRASLTRAAKPASAGAHKDTSAQQDEEHAAAKRKEKIEADIESLAHATAEKLELLQRPATDADYAGNLEHWIYPYERVDQLQLAAQKRLNAVRQDLECYRDGLARQLRDHDVVDGEFEEAPPRPLQGQAQPASPSNTVITVTSASGKEGTGAPVKPVTPRTTALMPPEPAPVQLDEMPAASDSPTAQRADMSRSTSASEDPIPGRPALVAVENNDDGIRPHDGSPNVVRPYSFGQVTMLAPASSTSEPPSKAFDRLCTPSEEQVLRATTKTEAQRPRPLGKDDPVPGSQQRPTAPWSDGIARALGLAPGSASTLSLEQVFSPPLMNKAASRPK